jgi:hypothetical protein
MAGQQPPSTETNTPPIPEELVGEWRLGQDPIEFVAIYLLADGHGMILARDTGTAIGSKIFATYTGETHTLTVTFIFKEKGDGPKTGYFQYDPNAGTLTAEGRDKPFSRLSPIVHPDIKKQFE